jgi:CheY-like chemotaxis protein
VATILIADDNSNVQKMVTLAFKDEGIDVVAVGNGDAAVRKAQELMPDLVLADIFMPVRNGYEVCEFIKQNARLAHVPVILLTGAFDPFDEREAQRVGADGVLKKPFVPPEPLVSLVKELLAKSAAEHLVPVSVTRMSSAGAPEKNSIAAPADATEPIAPRAISSAPAAFDLPAETESEEDVERPFKAFTLREDPEHFWNEGGSSAFGTFLDAGTEKHVEPPDVDLPERHKEESANENTSSKDFSGFSSWLSKTPALDSVAPPVEEIHSPLNSPSADRIARNWEIGHTSEARAEDETIVETLDRFAAEHFPANGHEPRKAEPEGTKANEFENEIVADATPEVSGTMEATEASVEAPVEAAGQPMTALAPQLSAEDTQTIDAIRSSSMPWHGVPSKFHTAAEDPAATNAEPFAEESFPEQATIGSPESSSAGTDAGDFDAPVYEVVRDEHESLLDSPLPVEALSAVIPSSLAESFSVPALAPMDPRQLEEIVTRVVERMQPQVLEVITREILRPVVEALVRRQLELK